MLTSVVRRVAQAVVRACCGEGGFTLVEVIVAMVLLTIGILGAASVVTMQSSSGVAGASVVGLAAVNRGNAMTTATMLAQQQLETLKNATFPPTASSGSISGYPNFSQTTTVSDVTGYTAAKYVTVVVNYRYASESGIDKGSSVILATIIAQRP